MPVFLVLAAITFHTNFEGGSLGKVEEIKRDHYRCPVAGEADQDKRNRQASWYYFRVDGARGRSLTLDMTQLPGEYNYRPNRGAITAETLPFYSEDGKAWSQVPDATFDDSVPLLRLRITPRANRIWIAHQPPYTTEHLGRMLTELRTHKALSTEVVGKTAGGRDMLLLTITDREPKDAARKHIWILFRQHAWESGSSWAGEGALRFLLSDDPEAARIRRAAVFKIFPMCDPDGVARGGVRFNAHGYDLNRNWDVSDPVKMPEIAAQRGAILRGGPVDMLVTLHNDENPEYVSGPPGPEYRDLLKRFEAELQRSAYFQATRPADLSPASTTEGKPGRMSVVQGLYRDRKLPAFLIEQMVVKHPKLGRQPNIEDRKRFGADLIRAVGRAILPAAGLPPGATSRDRP